MKLLSFTQRVLAFVGFMSGQRIFSVKWIHTIVSLLILVILIALESTSAVFMVKHLLIGEFQQSFQAGFQVTGTLPLIGSFVTFVYHKENIRKVIAAFQKIFDQCNSGHSKGDRQFDNIFSYLQVLIGRQQLPSYAPICFARSSLNILWAVFLQDTSLRHWVSWLSVPFIISYATDMLSRRNYFCHSNSGNLSYCDLVTTLVRNFIIIFSFNRKYAIEPLHVRRLDLSLLHQSAIWRHIRFGQYSNRYICHGHRIFLRSVRSSFSNNI